MNRPALQRGHSGLELNGTLVPQPEYQPLVPSVSLGTNTAHKNLALSLKIFTDFDGTVTVNDVGDALFERFGGVQCRDIIARYREGEYSAAECFRRECAACGVVDVGEMNAFLDGQPIDESFPAFVRYCRSKEIDLAVMSDGMDYYIRHILNRAGVGDMAVYSNILNFGDAGMGKVRFEPEFPHENESCDRCACCKRNIMLTNSGEDDILIMVGEGYSDRCPAKYADVVFAKDDFLKYCRAEGIIHYEYRTFADIQCRLDEMISEHHRRPGKSRLHKRRQAELARKALFIAE